MLVWPSSTTVDTSTVRTVGDDVTLVTTDVALEDWEAPLSDGPFEVDEVSETEADVVVEDGGNVDEGKEEVVGHAEAKSVSVGLTFVSRSVTMTGTVTVVTESRGRIEKTKYFGA